MYALISRNLKKRCRKILYVFIIGKNGKLRILTLCNLIISILFNRFSIHFIVFEIAVVNIEFEMSWWNILFIITLISTSGSLKCLIRNGKSEIILDFYSLI